MLRAVSPAPLWAALEVAPPSRRGRGCVLMQTARFDSIAYFDGDELAAVAMLIPLPERPGVVELCIGFAPPARRCMRALIRAAHSTLPMIADTGVVVTAVVSPRNPAGLRMARLAGFVGEGGEDDRRMVWRAA